MSRRSLSYRLLIGLLLIAGFATFATPISRGEEQEQLTRKTKSKVTPFYPELARRMNITGTVKVQITVDKNGIVRNTKLVGGHPILAGAAMDAVRKWRYESASEETTGIVEFHFDPTQ